MLYDIYFDDIFRYVAFRINSREDAEDIVSQTFEKAMRSIASFEWQGYRFGTWLYKIAHNLIIDTYKKNKPNVSLESIYELNDDTENIEDLVKREIDSERLIKAIDGLAEDQKEIIYLRYIKQLTLQETIEITGKTLDSIKSLSKRALKKIRSIIN